MPSTRISRTTKGSKAWASAGARSAAANKPGITPFL
ncbi:Uncharacterised protein [Bordetella pertussis]|nr:Uncharacterised protein [Bordetella pertussis]